IGRLYHAYPNYPAARNRWTHACWVHFDVSPAHSSPDSVDVCIDNAALSDKFAWVERTARVLQFVEPEHGFGSRPWDSRIREVVWELFRPCHSINHRGFDR